jgi:hypothetical protein
MTRRRRIDNTMTRRRIDNTMTRRRRTDNTMARRRMQTNGTGTANPSRAHEFTPGF